MSKIEEKCKTKGVRLTDQRRLIAKVMSEATDHPNVDALHKRVSKLDNKVSIATVYRTVKLFEESGIVEKHDFKGGKARYEESPEEHHDHLIDINDGKIIEFVDNDIERLQTKIAEKLGYKLVDHRLELYGTKLKKINILPKKIFIKTFGCQMNEYDSNRIADLAKEKGYIQTNNIRDTDCYVLNTCHIRAKATEKVYHDIGRLKKNFRNRKKPFVLVTGCVAQAENETMLKREPYIDAIVGPQSYHQLPKILFDLDNKKRKINSTDFDVIEKFDKLNSIKNSNSNISTFITIQEGCDKFCNFCVVPYTRGPEHSRSHQDIINEAKNLILNGAKEITLLGQNVNAYNYTDGKKNFKLSDLIFQLQDLDGLKRIRYTTSHPKDMTKDLIDCYKYAAKLMPLLHLPVQSGSNNILKSMNRKHSREEYLARIKDLIKIRPNMKFSSDFIVGYPGETEQDFSETILLVKEVNFINSFSFIYSPRPGTPAANIDTLDQETQKERLGTLQILLESIQKKQNRSEVGKLKEVLVENKLENQSKYFGRTRDLIPVIFSEADDSDIGNLVSVKIEKYNQNSLFGIKKTIQNEVAA